MESKKTEFGLKEEQFVIRQGENEVVLNDEIMTEIFHQFYYFSKEKKWKDTLVNLFHQIYYYSGDKTWRNTFWLGFPIFKCPLDLWIYQEILVEVQPDVIIETGTFKGASAYFLAIMCDIIGKGQVVTIDVEEQPDRPKHSRIKYLLGSSTSVGIVNQVKDLVKDKKKVLVILDSEHKKEHVIQELRIYSEFVTYRSYLIVEDSNVNGHPVRPDWGEGPMEAIQEFLKETRLFRIDRTKEKFLMTQNPNGYLKRIR